MHSTATRVLTALIAGGVVVTGSGVAYADNINDNINDNGTGVSIVAGAGGSANIKVVSSNGQDGDPDCNIDGGTENLTLSFNTPLGVTAPNVRITACDTDFTVPISTTSSAVSGTITANIAINTTGAGSYNNNVSIPVTITQPAVVTPPPPADTTDPTSSATATVPGGAYTSGSWTNQTVMVALSGQDAGSGPKEIRYTTDGSTPTASSTLYTAALTLATDTQTTIKYIAIDNAGNSQDVANEFVVKVDKTAPTVDPGNVNDTDWRNTDRSADFTASDNGSGLAAGQSLSATGGFTLTVSDESTLNAPTTASKTISDVAGNTTTRTLSARIDKTLPTVSAAQSNTAWSNAASVTSDNFTASDALSGIPDADKTFTLSVSAESTKVNGTIVPSSTTRTVTDAAGNSNNASFSALIDRTAPVAAFSAASPVNGQTYWSTQVPTAECASTDALSGLAATDGCVITRSANGGLHTVTVAATDKAGNTATASRSYTVRDLTSTGFYSPVDMGGVVNTVKGGSTVPLKFNIQVDGVQQTATSLVASFTANKTDCTLAGSDDIEIVTTGATSLRYDGTAAAGQFIQNWKTPTGAGTCYKATATLVDGEVISALFKLK